MLRRQILRQSRVAQKAPSTPGPSSSLSSTSISTCQRAHPSSTSSRNYILSSKIRPSVPQPNTQASQRRWASDEATEKKDDKLSTDGAAKPAEQSAEDAAKAELEKKNKEIIDLKDKYLRSVADYRNLQDRMKRDQESTRQFAIQRFAADLLDSIDNLDRALVSVPKSSVGEAPDASASSTTSNTSSADANVAAASESVPAPPNPDLLNLYSGLKMTNEIMLNTLKKHGLERFDPLEREGRKFNPSTDEATFFTKVEGQSDGEVFFTQSKGFTLNGRVIRAAKVGVVKNS